MDDKVFNQMVNDNASRDKRASTALGENEYDFKPSDKMQGAYSTA